MSAPAPLACRGCRHFRGEAQELEARLPGLSALSSAYAAVRAGDGLCLRHERYVAASSHCPDHEYPAPQD